MEIVRRAGVQAAALLLSFVATAASGETFWATQYGKLLAFDLDFQTGQAKYTMQATGDAGGSASYVGAARNPVTGELWVVYFDGQGQERVGRLRPGTAVPDLGVLIPGEFDAPMPSPAFSSAGVLYLRLDHFSGSEALATLDLGTGVVTPVLWFEGLDELTGIAFDPVSGKLFLSGYEDCTGGCTSFLDTLTVPGYERERLASWENFGPTQPLFGAAGELLITNTSFYRVHQLYLEWVGNPPAVENPFGFLYMGQFGGSPAEGTEGCVPSLTRACLQLRRFAVEATYDATAYGGTTGVATPRIESDESLKFSFFAPQNLEIFVKVIDGCGYNGHYWIFASGLTNLGVSLRVTDTAGGTVYAHDNPSGQTFAPLLDIQAFPCSL